MKKIPNHLAELRLIDLQIHKQVMMELLQIIDEKCLI